MNLIWKIEEKTYQTKALLEVMQDGLCNDVVGINQDYYATVLRVVMDKVDEIQRAIEEDYRQRREEMQDENDEYEEDDTDGEDSLLGEGSIFGDETSPEFRSSLYNSETEGCEDAGDKGAAKNFGEPAGSLDVKMVTEHPDGSATFEIHGSKDQMDKLFSAFFREAIVRGIDASEDSSNTWATREKIVGKAIELEKALKTWESVDEFDYDPEVRKIRKDLTDLIIEYGAVR